VSEQYNPICVEHILVSLDSSTHSFSALKAAIELAAHYSAKITGVFIHDSILLNLAQMAFLQEVGEYTALTRKISHDRISQGMIVQSRWINRTFYKMIDQSGVDGEFSILRGKVNEIIDQQAEKCDLLVIGKSGTNPLGRPRLGSTAKALIEKSRKSLLLVEEGNLLGYPMFVLFEDSDLGWISLETGRDLLAPGENLNILIEKDGSGNYERLQKIIRSWAIEKQVNIIFQPYRSETFVRFLQKIYRLKTGLFIMPYFQEMLNRKLIDQCITDISLPILMIQN
jgi:nucleotide-binding universal stress UspA family protein